MKKYLQSNLSIIITFILILVFLFAAAQGMATRDFLITLLRALSIGSVTFLVASGFSLIFGLLDVLNLAQGTLYMIGAYVGWTVYVRPDTFVDLVTPLALFIAPFLLPKVWLILADKVHLNPKPRRLLAWGLVVAAIGLFVLVINNYPIAMWDLDVYTQSPITYSYMADQGARLPVVAAAFDKISPVVAVVSLLLIGALGAFGLALNKDTYLNNKKVAWKELIGFGLLVLISCLVLAFNSQITSWMLAIDTTWLFLIAIIVAVGFGVGLGALMETTLIRPLYNRPI